MPEAHRAYSDIFDTACPPTWLFSFEHDEDRAVADFLSEVFDHGTLAAASPSQLLIDWLRRIGSVNAFATRVDAALARWVAANWLAQTARPRRRADEWGILLDVVARSAELPGATVEALRARAAIRIDALGSISKAAGVDALGRYLHALAVTQDDRALAPIWWQTVRLLPGVPVRHGLYGVEGVVEMPPESGDDGAFRAEVVQAVRLLSEALEGLLRSGTLEGAEAYDFLIEAADAAWTAYPFPQEWRQTLELSEADVPRLMGDWLEEIGVSEASLPSTHRVRVRREDPTWSERTRKAIADVAHGDTGALSHVYSLIDEQREHAVTTGNTYYVVRALCNLAQEIVEKDPDAAVRLTTEARDFEPSNPFPWGQLVHARLLRDGAAATLELAWHVTELFPEDHVKWEELARILREAGFPVVAARVYVQAARWFPDSPLALTGLAEVYRLAGDVLTAARLYAAAAPMEARAVPRGIARVRRAARSVDPTTKQAVEAVLASVGETVLDAEEVLAALPPLTAEFVLPPTSSTTSRRALVRLLRRWVREGAPPAVEAALLHLLEGDGDGVDAATIAERALAALERGNADEADEVLRQTPLEDDVRIAYVRARIARTRNLGKRLRRPSDVDELRRPWQELRAREPQMYPVSLLGEGRACLGARDGEVLRAEAERAFARLREWMSGSATDHESAFVEQWAASVQTNVFRNAAVTLGSLQVWTQLQADRLDALEENYVDRIEIQAV